MVDVRHSFAEPLTEQKLFAWHEMLFSQSRRIHAGVWRRDSSPMQVVSGAIGKEKIHFGAPPSFRVPDDMRRFIQWFNDTAPGGKTEIRRAAVRSATAHLYFETIHPLEDGNGRMAIAEKALAQTIGHPVLLSLLRAIEADRQAYYSILEQAQKSNEVTSWIEYFTAVTLRAQKQSRQSINFILKKSRFFDPFKDALNDRQAKVTKRMLEAGSEGFEGGMTANKYISITKASKATATRDLQQLFDWEVLLVEGGGRSTRYKLNL